MAADYAVIRRLRQDQCCRFIATGHIPHQAINLSSTEAAQAIVARNDPNEQESVVLYDPAEEG